MTLKSNSPCTIHTIRDSKPTPTSDHPLATIEECPDKREKRACGISGGTCISSQRRFETMTTILAVLLLVMVVVPVRRMILFVVEFGGTVRIPVVIGV
jgi:hypothetical protein